MKRKRIISMVVFVCILLTFIPFQAMAVTDLTASVTFAYDSHVNEYAIMNGEIKIESGDQVPIGTKLKIVPAEDTPEGYVINSFRLYSYDGTEEIHDKIEGDSFIVTKDVEIYDVELSYLVGKNEGDIWVYDNYFYIWESADLDESGRIDSYDFIELYNSEDFGLESHLLDYYHTLTSKGEEINSNIYVLKVDKGYEELYFGNLNLGTGGVYGFSYDIEVNNEKSTYYPDINLIKGKLTADEIIGEAYIWVDEEMQVYIKNDFIGYDISSYGGTIVVDGDITAQDIWFDSDNAPLFVTVGGNINTVWFDHEGGYVHVKESIIADDEQFDIDLTDNEDLYDQPYIDVESDYADYNPTQLIVDGDIKTGEEGYIEIGDEEGSFGPMMMNSLNMRSKSAEKSRKNKDYKSDNRMMVAFNEEDEVDLYVEVYAGGNIEAGREIYINNGTVIAEGSIKTTNEETNRTIYIYGGNVKCKEMQSATGIEIYDNPMATSVDVKGNMTAEHSIYMSRNSYLFSDNNGDGFIELNVGGIIRSQENIIIGSEPNLKAKSINDVHMYIDVNAGGIEAGDSILAYGSNLSEGASSFLLISPYTVKINIDGNMTAPYMILLVYSDVYVSGSINKTGSLAEEDDEREDLLGIGGSIVRCGTMTSETDIVVANIGPSLEPFVVVEGNMAAENITMENGRIYASQIAAEDKIFIDDYATLFDALNNNEEVRPENRFLDGLELFRTKLTGLAPNATVEIEIYNENYYDSVKAFTTDADDEGNIYVWLLGGDEAVGRAYYGNLQTLVTSPSAISSDGDELEFKPLDVKLAEISLNIPDGIYDFNLMNPWSHYEAEEYPFNPANWIFEYDGDIIGGFPEDLGAYELVFTRNGQRCDLYDINDSNMIELLLAGEYKVTVAIEAEIEGETYIAVGADEFTIEPLMISIIADNKKALVGSQIGQDFFTVSYSVNLDLVEEAGLEALAGMLVNGYRAKCYATSDKAGTYPIYVIPDFSDNLHFIKNILKLALDNSIQVKLIDGTFTVSKKTEPSSGSSLTYYTITASAGEGGSIAPEGSIRVARRSDKTFEIRPDAGYVIKDVLIDGISVGKVDSYTFENVTNDATIEALFSPEEWENPFEDVDEDDWFYKAVEFCVKRGIFTGMTDDSFQPNTPITRGMFVTVLGRLSNINPEDYKEKVFDDVELGQWYSPYVQWAFENEIVRGYDEKTFGPDDRITREQMCSIIVRYCDYAKLDLEERVEGIAFADEQLISSWAKDYVRKSQMAELIQGIGNNLFNPLGNASRAEAAALLMRLIQNVIE